MKLSSELKLPAVSMSGFETPLSEEEQAIQASVHRFARDLRPTVLDDLGLIPALQSYLKNFKDQTGLLVELTAFTGVEKLDGGAKTVLYRIVQESLANVVQHAQASRVNVRIMNHKKVVCMDVHDDGRGFDMHGVGAAESGKHLGLLGMRERVEMVGGTFCVESAPGKRTTIRVEIPHADASLKKTSLKKSGNATLECP